MDVIEHMQRYAPEHFTTIVKRVTDLELKVAARTEEGPVGSATQPTQILPKLESLEEKVKKLEIQLETTTHKYSSTAGSGMREPSGGGAMAARAEPGIGYTSAALRELPEIQEKMQIYEGVMTVLNREIEKLTIQADTSENLQKADRELFDVMDRKIKSLERQMAMKDATIAELELRTTSLELTSYDGTLVWKIADFSRKRQEAISGRTPSIYSTPFYTSKTGYKLCARIYLNGDGMGRGTHVSLFFVVMRGQYDAMLKWPFRQKVTLMFLDQNNREHVLDAFRPDPTSSSFKRPVSEMNIASGCPLFLALTQLDNQANAYVKDNTAFLKLIVSTDDLNA